MIISCKFCSSTAVMKDGVRSRVQYYFCKGCHRKFAGNNALPGMRFPPDQIATSVSLFYEGLSLEAIRRQMNEIYSVMPSDSTIYEWIVRFSKLAVERAGKYKVRTGDIWGADETVLDVAGGRTKSNSDNTIWFWDVIDDSTRFLLGSHLSWVRTTRDAEALFMQAMKHASRPPKFIITDKLSAYIGGIENVFGANAKHIQSQGFITETHNNTIERLHGTIKQRTKVMRGMKSRATAKVVMDGWLIHYNFFRPHESLHGKTPAEVAGIHLPFDSWKTLIATQV